MNFTPFGGHFPASIPTIHQFAAKFGHESNPNAGLCQPAETNSSRYTANGVPSFTQHHPPQQHMVTGGKYQGATYMNQSYSQQNQQPQQQQQGPQQHQGHDKRQNNEKPKDLHQDDRRNHHQQQQQQQSQQGQQSQLAQQNNQLINTTTTMPSTWQSLAAPGSTVADYLSHLPASTLPLSLHHFLKYSAEIKKETAPQQLSIPGANDPGNVGLLPNIPNPAGIQNANLLSTNLGTLSTINHAQLQNNPPPKKKKKKKPEKEKKPKPKPGEIRLTTALDGSTLYCCPECHMAYPEKELLEQHLVGHTLERRFVCDICGAGLKRKDHLTRHKQSHNPERPYVCTVCLKAFKRKEQLTLHFVIHSGEKRHVCTECGKGFYRKDHLRKHTRSHIARRVKAELSQQGPSNTSSLQLPSSSGSAQSIMS